MSLLHHPWFNLARLSLQTSEINGKTTEIIMCHCLKRFQIFQLFSLETLISWSSCFWNVFINSRPKKEQLGSWFLYPVMERVSSAFSKPQLFTWRISRAAKCWTEIFWEWQSPNTKSDLWWWFRYKNHYIPRISLFLLIEFPLLIHK